MKTAPAVLVAMLLTVCGLSLTAHSQPIPRPFGPPPELVVRPPGDPICDLSWMIGSWEGEEGFGASRETVRFKAWLSSSGHAIIFHVDTVHGSTVTPRYDGMYYWIPALKTYVIRQTAITGGVVEGELRLEGTKATQTETVYNPDGSRSAIRIEYTVGPDRFHVHAQFRASETSEWIPAQEMDYRKIA